MSAPPERRTRPTIRCLHDDLCIELPTVDVDLGSVEHPLMDEVRRVSPSAPRGQKRILRSIIRSSTGFGMVGGVARHGSKRTPHGSGCWPAPSGRQDRATTRTTCSPPCTPRGACCLVMTTLRDEVERDARVIAATRTEAPRALAAASAAPETDVPILLAGLVAARMLVSAAGDEVWVAIATRAADGVFVADGLRDLLFRIVFEAAGAELSEARTDWPSGPLEWFEVVRLGLREPAQ